MEDPAPPPPARPRPHPLPGFCWMWLLGVLHLGVMAVLLIMALQDDTLLDKDRSMFIFYACLFGLLSAAYALLWFHFALKKRLDRGLWHFGTGLIAAGAAMLFVTGFTF